MGVERGGEEGVGTMRVQMMWWGDARWSRGGETNSSSSKTNFRIRFSMTLSSFTRSHCSLRGSCVDVRAHEVGPRDPAPRGPQLLRGPLRRRGCQLRRVPHGTFQSANDVCEL